MELFSLTVNKGARKTRKRIGRGQGSGVGKTSGKGHKGQLARAGGKVRAGFEGGQMPLYRRVPKFGFISRKKTSGVNDFAVINLSLLDKFEAGSTLDLDTLRKKLGLTSKDGRGQKIKVLGNGTISKSLNIKVHAVSSSAREKIEAAGGTVELIAG
jgi:large subunit ribosomal protein L15